MHGVHDEVARAVHDAADGDDAVEPLTALEVHEPRNAAADGGGAAQGDTVLPGESRQLRIVRRDDGLVRRDDVLARLDGGADVLIGRVQPTHDLDDRVDGGVVENVLDTAGGNRFDAGLAAAHQHAVDGEIRAAARPVVDAGTHDAEAEKSNMHNTPP